MSLSKLDANALLENLHTGVVVHGPDTQIRYANPAALELLRLTKEQVLGKDAFDPQWKFVDHYKRPLMPEYYPINRVIASHEPVKDCEVGICDSSTDQITWVLCNVYPEIEKGNIHQIVVTFIDITHKKLDIPFKDIVEKANDVILVTEAEYAAGSSPKVIYANNAFTHLSGYKKEEIYGKTPKILQGEETSEAVRHRIATALEKRQPIREQILNYTKSGDRYWLDMNIFPLTNEMGEVCFFAAVERDVTEIKRYERELKELTIRDSLTGLLNRRGFLETVNHQLDVALRKGLTLTLAMIDIDHFKQVNDNFGHAVGDEALRHFSSLASQYFRKSDILGRLGGEEFSLVLIESEHAQSHKKLTDFQAYLANNPVILESGQSIAFTISIGLACLTDQHQTLEALLKIADKGLYAAKRTGRNKICHIAPV